MDWRNWKHHPFIVTIVGALLLGYMVRKCTEPARPTYHYSTERPAASGQEAKPVSTPVASTQPDPVRSAPVAAAPTTSAPSAYLSPPERPVISTPSYGSGRRGYTTYTFTLDNIAYLLDGQASFDHLSEMKQQAHVYDPEINRLRAECATLQAQIDSNRSQLAVLRSVLDRTDQSAVDGFNAQVRSSNAVIAEHRVKVAELNANVDRFNQIVSAMHAYAQQHRR
jgi:hypothetical protein